LALIHSFRLFL